MAHPLLVLFSFLVTNFVFASELENKVFDHNRTNAIELLQKEYQRSKVLFIGFYHHYSHQHIEQLSSLLKKVGDDPHLKFIVLERAGDVSKFYEMLSTQDLESSIKHFQFSTEEAKKETLCRGPGEWSYAIKNFFPVLREINQQRLENPIIAKSIDGHQTYMAGEGWPGLDRPMNDGTCSTRTLYRNGHFMTLYGISNTREQATADNFKTRIWEKLGPNDKAIVLYHRAHLLEGFEVCQPQMITENNWIANVGPASWYGRFLKTLPEARKNTSLVLIDEKFDPNKEMINFNFTKRQSLRFPNTDWAVNLNPFSGILTEVGFDMFTKESDMHFFRSDYSSSSSTLPDIANGLIFNSQAHIQYRNLKSSDYLPEHCSIINK